MNDTNSTHHGHGNGHARFGYCVHCSTEKWDFLVDVPCEAGGYIGIARQKVCILGYQRDIVERESLVGKGLHKVIKMII